MAQGAERILTGLKEIDRKIKELKQGAANRVARAGLVKGMRVLVKVTKAVAGNQKTVKAAIGGRVKQERSGVTKVKVGAGVGKKPKKEKKNRSKSKGTGISTNNVHWYVLGTKKRRQEKTGRETGAMPAHDLVKRGFSAAESRVKEAVKEGAEAQLEKELAKLAKK